MPHPLLTSAMRMHGREVVHISLLLCTRLEVSGPTPHRQHLASYSNGIYKSGMRCVPDRRRVAALLEYWRDHGCCCASCCALHISRRFGKQQIDTWRPSSNGVAIKGLHRVYPTDLFTLTTFVRSRQRMRYVYLGGSTRCRFKVI